MSTSTDAIWLGIAGVAAVAILAALFQSPPQTEVNASVGISSQTPQQLQSDTPTAKTETKAQVTVTPDQTTLGLQTSNEYTLQHGSKKIGEAADAMKSLAETMRQSIEN